MALDKLSGNSFATGAIANSLGYTPANKAGDTFTGNTSITGTANVSSTLIVGTYGVPSTGTGFRTTSGDIYGQTNAVDTVHIGVASNTWFTGGSVGVGTSSPSATLTVSGTANVSGVTSFGNNVSVTGNTVLERATNVYIPHTGVTGGYGNTSVSRLKFGSYGRLQHTSYNNLPIITFNAELYDSDFSGSGSGGGYSNKIRPDYGLGSYGIISMVNGGVAFNTGQWNSNSSIDVGDIGSHGSYAGGVDASGRWSKPKQPAFKYLAFTLNSSGIGNNGAVVLNQGSHFSSSTGRFTAPVAGVYWFGISVLMESNSGRMEINFTRNGSSTIDGKDYMSANDWAGGSNSYTTCGAYYILYLAANDYVSAFVNIGTAYSGMANRHDTCFQGYLIG